MTDDDKIRENRLRRMAQRQGLQLQKSRRRDPRAVDYGTYQLVDPRTNALVSYGMQSGYGLSLDEIEQRLSVAPAKNPLGPHRHTQPPG